MMNTHDYIPVIKTVLSDKRVIICAVIVFLLMDLGAFIVRYRKKPKVKNAKKTIAAPAPAPAESSGEESGDGGEEGEE